VTATALRPAPQAAPPPPASPTLPWLPAIASGVAVLLAGLPVRAVVQGWTWFGDAAVVVAVVVAVGLMLHRAGVAVVAAGQCAAVLLLLTALHTQVGVLGVFPGPETWAEFGSLVAGAGGQIAVGIAPVAATAEITFLVTAAFGLVAVAVYLAAVGAAAPAAGGVPLLAMFAVPAALSDDLLPWWALVGAASAFGLLLVARRGARRQLPGGTALIAGAVAAALGVGAVTGFVGTSGRFDGAGGGAGGGGAIGLSPFTALRGQLDQSESTELFRVRGLPQATYLRALTLRDYVPNAGWQATRPDPGPALPGTVDPSFTGPMATLDIENVGFRDYWLPLYGRPVRVSDLSSGQWTYDARSGTAYTSRPREEDSWQQLASFVAPTAAQLRAADGRQSPGADYLNVAGVDRRVTNLARQVVQGQDTAFDRAMALQEFFTGPESRFAYSLQTAPGGSDDALVEFLTVGRAGYCEQFASAMAVMLRTVGVPARVAVGFTGGRDEQGYRSVSTSDAHAWVEAWFPDIGWTTFDPTPLTDGRTVTPPYVAEAEAEAAGPNGADTATDPRDERPSATPTPAPATPEPATPDLAAPAPAEPGPATWPYALLGAVALGVLALLLPAALRSRERRRRLATVNGGGPDAAAAAWAELLAESEDRGVASPPTDTVRAAARRLVHEHHLDDGAQQALRQVVGAVEASWYGGAAPGTPLAAPVRDVLAGIGADRRPSLRERLLPRSVTRRGLFRRRRPAGPEDEPTR
jgi:transglutaminase-like putative cysteine protease